MIKEVTEALSEIKQQECDRRFHFCQVEVTTLENGSCVLAGTVSDKDTLSIVMNGLRIRFPLLSFDSAAIRTLRQTPAQLLTVGTNLTGLYAEPSFGAEMLSELRGGTVVECLQKQGKWSYVRQTDGYLGWVYAPYLRQKAAREPTHIVAEPITALYERPDLDAPVVGRLLSATYVSLGATEANWGQVDKTAGHDGWLPLPALRALNALPGDEDGKRQQMVRDGLRYIGVPYLWGGTTAFGLDCSGYVQMLHYLSGVTIPRDADLQFAAGQAVEPPFEAGDLLFFGSERGHRSISHVGMSIGGWQMVHASRAHNGVYVDDVQAVDWLSDIFLGARTLLDGGS